MPTSPLYPDANAFGCDVLILCEGDAVGYEAQMLKAWADNPDLDLGGRFVQAQACGTSTALYGMADAVGRTVRVVVVEDRDFRNRDEARTDCEKKQRNRCGRNNTVAGWLAWSRNEIENYFTDDDLLPAVFAGAFGCGEEDIRTAVGEEIEQLRVAQALECALYHARRRWESSDADRHLRVAPFHSENGADAPTDAKEVRQKLESRLTKWRGRYGGKIADSVLDDFDKKTEEWKGVTYDNDVWRRDWACKEVLQRTRMRLAASHGWWKDGSRQRIDWASFGNKQRHDAQDREIERVMQPELIGAALKMIDESPECDLAQDLTRLAEAIRSV